MQGTHFKKLKNNKYKQQFVRKNIGVALPPIRLQIGKNITILNLSAAIDISHDCMWYMLSIRHPNLTQEIINWLKTDFGVTSISHQPKSTIYAGLKNIQRDKHY